MKKFTNIISVVGIIAFGVLMIGATTPYTFNTITSTGTAKFATVSVDGGSITLNAGGRIDTTSMNVSDTMIVLNADGSASFADGVTTINVNGGIISGKESGGANGYFAMFNSGADKTVELNGSTGSASFANGAATIGADGTIRNGISGVGSIEVQNGDGAAGVNLNGASRSLFNFNIGVKSSLDTAGYANVGGTLKVNTTTTGNIGAGEDNLISYTVPANTLANDGEYLEFDCWGSFAATATLKQLRLYVDTAQFDTTSLLLNGKPWRAHGKIVRTDNTHCSVACEFTVGGTLLSSVNGTVVTVSVANPNPLDANSFVFKVTGQDNGITPADNAVIQNAMILKWYPAQ